MTPTDGGLHLGKKPASFDKRDTLWSDFRPGLVRAGLLPKIPTIPWGHGNDFLGEEWMMLGNGPDESVAPGFDGCGDCAWAGPAHEHMAFARNAVNAIPPFKGDCVVTEYERYSGFKRETLENDNGTDLHELCKWRQKKGITDDNGAKHFIGDYIFGEPRNVQDLLEIAYLFECAGIGIEFPDTADAQFARNKPWSYVGGYQIIGGHYIPVMGRPREGVTALITWARRQLMTYKFFEHFNDEIIAYVTQEMFNKVTGKTWEGHKAEQLEEYLHLVAKAKMNA